MHFLFPIFSESISFQFSRKLGIPSTFLILTTSQKSWDESSTNLPKLFANCKFKPSSDFLILHVNFKSKISSKPKKSYYDVLYLFLFIVLTLYTLFLHYLILRYNFHDFLWNIKIFSKTCYLVERRENILYLLNNNEKFNSVDLDTLKFKI